MACPPLGRRTVAACLGLAAWLMVAADAPRLEDRQKAPSRPGAGRPDRDASAPGSASSGWWSGSAGVGLALAAFGGLALLSRRFLPAREFGGGSLRVVGRVSLSPRQAVYLVRVGDRTLIVGAGSQGPPALLGEWADPAPAEPSAPARRAPAVPRPVTVAVPRPGGFDQRIGDDE